MKEEVLKTFDLDIDLLFNIREYCRARRIEIENEAEQEVGRISAGSGVADFPIILSSQRNRVFLLELSKPKEVALKITGIELNRSNFPKVAIAVLSFILFLFVSAMFLPLPLSFVVASIYAYVTVRRASQWKTKVYNKTGYTTRD